LFHVRGSHHFWVFVEAKVGPHTPASVIVSASRGRDGGSVTSTYEVRNPRLVRPHRIAASLGELGKIHVRYVPRKRVGSCSQPTGTFRGVIRFRGEDGYTTAHARKVPGVLSPYWCEGHRHVAREPRRRQASLLTSCRLPRRTAYLAYGAARAAAHQIQVFERGGRLKITRFGSFQDSGGSFHVDLAQHTATLSPGWPFSGSATYADGRLTGNLTASLPGLAGPVEITPAHASLGEGVTKQCERVTAGIRRGAPR
jgi:hypothetical protein